jgi:hypothetical protein
LAQNPVLTGNSRMSESRELRLQHTPDRRFGDEHVTLPAVNVIAACVVGWARCIAGSTVMPFQMKGADLM